MMSHRLFGWGHSFFVYLEPKDNSGSLFITNKLLVIILSSAGISFVDKRFAILFSRNGNLKRIVSICLRTRPY